MTHVKRKGRELGTIFDRAVAMVEVIAVGEVMGGA